MPDDAMKITFKPREECPVVNGNLIRIAEIEKPAAEDKPNVPHVVITREMALMFNTGICGNQRCPVCGNGGTHNAKAR
jgi:hypothetical protein